MNPELQDALGAIRQDIRDLRGDLDPRLRSVEQQAASARTMSKVGLSAVPFAVVGFSFALVHVFGG